ncbi:protein unc-79 homolog isoform X2 [Condylostylus longicornis]|uniref:protein unc-79 homolog isoform X2 n=1 Tax=Condylostylus longicornis TaxID=2530218 RepID=UPI00244DC141|nr:protein unc-79 homolog isoform X2 [Condylostylus longicornis]
MTGSFKVQLINMGTRAAAFQAKLRCLHEYHIRLLHNTQPAPSGIDIANTIKYFSQTLLTVLKDVPNSPHLLIKDPTMDQTRMAAYPNLEYGNLYNALTMLLDVAPCIPYSQVVDFGKALVQCFCCILPFLDKDLIDNLPYLVSSTISVLPPILHQDVINALCFYILPFTITRQSPEEQVCQAAQSVSAVIMMVFQYSNNPAHHCQLLECLMALKNNVAKDILCVIAYGTAQSRSSAAKLLFYYWPAFDPNLFDRKGLLSKLTNDLIPFVCQREQCPNSGNAEAAKVCFDHGISIAYAPDCPPPLYLCIECANEIHREHPNLTFGDMLHPMQQVSMVCENKNCRSNEKAAYSICFSTECASYNGNHPIRYCLQCHNNRHNARRGGDHIVHRSLPPAFQMDAEMQMYMIESVVSLLRESKPLCFEPAGREASGSVGTPGAEPKNGNSNGLQDNISIEERQLLGRYGIWLLVGRCSPTKDTPIETLGRLLGMLFHWFHVTAYSYDAAGQIESAIEKLKIEHVCAWLKEICREHYNTFIGCLLPHPPEYSRVGGHWETLASRTSHLKEGLQRLICLVPYEVITSEIWDYVMPHWMEAITNDVGEKELQELKIVLSKILDPEMSPLGFDAKTMYNFVAIRFEKTTAKVQQQALHWLQILTKLEILIPLSQLFAMFGDGVRIMKYGVQHEILKEKESKGHKPAQKEKDTLSAPPRRSSISPVVEDDSGNTSAISDDEAPTNRHTEFSTDAEHNLTCCILMLDILLKQMELQDVEQHTGIHTNVCENVCRLIKCMVTAARVGLSSHVCALKVAECAYCEASIMWHQLSSKLVQFMAPKIPVRPPDPPIEENVDDEKSARKSPPENDKEKSRDVSLSMAPLPIPLGPLGGFAGIPFIPDETGKILIMAGPVPVAVPQPEPHSVGGVLVHMPHVCSTNERGRSNENTNDLTRNVQATDEIMTATVDTGEQFDLSAIIPEKTTGVARSSTIQETDAQSQKNISGLGDTDKNETLIEENGDDLEDGDDIWHTSVGKFRFNLDSLPQVLQYIHQLLTEIPTIQKPDILYYILQCLNVMALHGDALTKAVREHRGFFIWCQENLLIKNLWDLCNAEHSHICQAGVPLLLHCITLPLGSDVFWRVVQEDFHDPDWRVRFTAVERVTVITRFMDTTPLRSEVGLQTALATAFCHLIASMDDINVHVAQRATLYLGTIHDNAIRSLLFCLESQFDLFIVDRPVVLQSLYQLHNSLSDRKVLTWDFFLNRFDTLFVEAQINLEKSGDISYLRDLRNSENGSEVLSMKINKAREALSHSDTNSSMAKTLSASFGTKWPYKRTMSAPASMIPRQESKMEKEKVYSRQISAPILKRKTSRFGLDGQIHSIGAAEELSAIIHRIIELEESDKETIHLLVFLLMQFMSRVDQAFPSEEKPMVKTQNIVLKHLFLLLGHNQLEKTFHVTPTKLRSSAVFNSFLANLPQVLDQNHLIGGLILPSALQVLLFAPNPSNIGVDAFQNLVYNYSLWHLEAHARRNWLMSVLVVLYKYEYTQPPYSGYINSVIRIVLNCLKAQFHQCKRIPTRTILDIQPVLRSRDASQPSLGTDPDLNRQESPPPSPIFPSEGTSHGTSGGSRTKTQTATGFPQKPAQPGFRKYQDSSIECDDTESELVAIPESDFSDSTMHGSSAPGSFDDPVHFDEIAAPLKPEILKNRTHVTTANLATAHVALSTLKASEHHHHHHEEKKDLSKKQHRLSVTTIITRPTDTTVKTNKMVDSKCSLQEGVRMMVTPSMIMTSDVEKEKFLSQQKERPKTPEMTATSKMFASIASNHLKAIGALHDVDTKVSPTLIENRISTQDLQPLAAKPPTGYIINGTSKTNGTFPELRKGSPPYSTAKPLGRHQKIIEPTPATTPVGSSSSPSTNTDSSRSDGKIRKSLKSLEKTFGSPESPLSKMNVMPYPNDDLPKDSFPKPKQISQLEFPTPERLLPIGEGISSIADRVREALNIPDISHLKQDSLDISESTKEDISTSTRTNSPRKLIKQVALESPPNAQGDIHTTILKSVSHDPKQQNGTNIDKKVDLNTQPPGRAKPKLRKVGPFAVDSQSIPDVRSRFAGSWPPMNDRDFYDPPEEDSGNGNTSQSEYKMSSSRVGDDCVCLRCSECGSMIEEYSDEEIGLLIIILGTFIHREPSMAAPFLPEILTCVSKFALRSTFTWQHESNTHLPGGSQSVAHQFLRCVLHQLAPNGVFLQLFQTQVKAEVRKKYFRSIAQALLDFQELNPISPIYLVCEALNSKKHLPVDILPVIIRNMAEYLHSIPSENGLGPVAWQTPLQALDVLFRQLIIILPSLENLESLLEIMVSVLKAPGASKGLLDPFSKVLSFCIQNIHVKHKIMYDLCTFSIRAFSKDRDKFFLCRQIIFELIQALKFKINIPDSNLLLIVGTALQDAGGALPPGTIEGLPDHPPVYTTNMADAMRQYMNDIMDFLADFHTLSKIKNFKNNSQTSNGFGEDTLGGVLKGAIAQYLALEMSRGNSRDNKAVSRYLPWLHNAPSSLQQGPKEFTECVGHMRLLSWLLMGSLTHTALAAKKSGPIGQHASVTHLHQQQQGIVQPVPQEASCHIADHIQVIFAGFSEQSKTSVLHMSSLFHAFTLCQLWTVYLEQISYTSAHNSEGYNVTMGILFEFWAKVTPCILQLVSHAKVLSEMVNLHFLSLLEALKETHSTILGKLLPLFSPVLSSQTQSGTLHVRLQSVRDYAPDLEEQQTLQSEALLKWLQRLQFKMGQIELQSSTATQFYSI